VFTDRLEAGILLSQKLVNFKARRDVLVVGIPRGGVVTAKTISDFLNLPLNVIVARKVGAPQQLELAIGAVSEGDITVIDEELVTRVGVDKKDLEKMISKKKEEVRERVNKFRGGKKLDLKRKVIILVDDGVATGTTIEAAVKYLRSQEVKKLILAVPVISKDVFERIKKIVDDIVALEIPEGLSAVGEFYENFSQVEDEEVVKLLQND